jgi:hypothetical protein
MAPNCGPLSRPRPGGDPSVQRWQVNSIKRLIVAGQQRQYFLAITVGETISRKAFLKRHQDFLNSIFELITGGTKTLNNIVCKVLFEVSFELRFQLFKQLPVITMHVSAAPSPARGTL